jgi:hypothetical protein
MTRTSVGLVAAAALAASACGQAHLTPSFGVANRAAFEAQRVRAADEPAPKPNMALDAQETSVIAEGYVHSLAPKAGQAEPHPMLYVAPQQNGAPPQPIAPSVPRE